MKTIKRFSIFLLIVLSCLIMVSAQSPVDETDAITINDIKEFIANSKKAGKTWGIAEEKYVLDNFGRPELIKEFDKAEVRNKIEITKDVKLFVLVDYLLTEFNGINALSKVLDSVAKGESTSVAKQLKTQVANVNTKDYRTSYIQIEVNQTKVDVIIDSKPFRQKDNNSKFTVSPGITHSIEIRKNGFSSCTSPETLSEGELKIVTCTLNPN